MEYRRKKGSDTWHWCKIAVNGLKVTMMLQILSLQQGRNVMNASQKKKIKSVRNNYNQY